MPMPTFQAPQGQQSVAQIQDYLVKLIRDLNFTLTNLDTLNINNLDAKVIETGVLQADSVTVKADLAGGAYIQLDSTGLKAYNGAVNTLEIDSSGKITIHSPLTGSAFITLDDTGLITNNGTIDTLVIDTNGDATFTGAITGGTINVSTDVTIGNKLILNDLSLSGGVQWGTGTSLVAQIFYDPTVPGLLLSCSTGPIDFYAPTNFIGSVNFTGSSINFTGSAVTGLNTLGAGGHNHGITPGTTLLYGHYDSGTSAWVIDGNVGFVAAVDHTHTVT